MPEPTRPRRPIAAMHKGPGPVYSLNPVVGFVDHCDSKRRLPAFSMAGRGKLLGDDCSPGPKYAIEKGFTRTGPDGATKVGVSGRHKDLTMFQTPSPAAYKVNADPIKLKAPEYTILGRTAPRILNQTPAPNAYTVPTTMGEKCVDKSSAPAYQLRSRPTVGSFSEDLQRTPGPGAYKTTGPNAYKRKCPEYSMTARNEVPGDSTQKPGPGAHKPENVKVHLPAAPSHSFGIKHSEYSGTVITQGPEAFCD